MVAAHQSHWLGEEGETQKQVTSGEVSSSFLTLSLLLLQSLDCSIIHLSAASASSGMVQTVCKVNGLCSNDSQQLFRCLWTPFLADRTLLDSFSGAQCDTVCS